MRWKEEIENKHYHGQQRIITKQEYRIDPSYHWVNLCFV